MARKPTALVPLEPPPPKRTGRPTGYSEALAVEICSRIAAGETLLEICRDPDIPVAEATVRGWDLDDRAGISQKYKGFSAMYARARLMQIEHEVDEIKYISDNPSIGFVTTRKGVQQKDGTVVTLIEEKTQDMLGHRQLQVEARKWRAGKIAWRNYGDQLYKSQGDEDNKEDSGNRIIIEGGLPDDNG